MIIQGQAGEAFLLERILWKQTHLNTYGLCSIRRASTNVADRLATAILSNFPEVLPYSHRWHTVLSSSITSESDSDNGSSSRHISTIFGRSPCDFPFSCIFTRTNSGLPNANQAMWHLSGERNHKRACKILRLYCQGLTEDEISDKLKISQQAVNQSLARSIERLKVVAKRL